MSEVWRQLGRVVLEEAKQVGTRAAAHGLKSVFRDVDRAFEGGRRRVRNAIKTLEEIAEFVETPDDKSDDE